MRRLAFMMLFGVFATSANVYSQEGVISLKMKNVSLVKLFEEVTRKTGYDFLYNYDAMQKKGNVNVDVKSVPLKDFLTGVLEEKGLEYEFRDEVIIVQNKEQVADSKPMAQVVKKRTVSGTVKDTDGLPVPGASVIVKGTQIGVATDVDGKFQIKVDDRQDLVFQITFVGMKSKEVKGGNVKVLNIVLEYDTKALEEVMITGYQTISRERATGAFDIVSADQLSKPTSDIATRLIGTMAGVQNRLDSDGKLVFEIRGQTSLNTDTRPLVVIDGFAVEDDFSSINPNDVESMTILKDAAAASIWGARSANGVIVITTKKGKANAAKGMNVNVSAFVKISPKLDLDTYYPFVSSEEVVEYEKRGFATDFFGSFWGPIDDSYLNVTEDYSQAVVALNENRLGYMSDDEMNRILEQLKKQDNRSQIKKYLLQLPITQQYNVSISGATEKMNNVLSLMYENEKDYFKENNTDRVLINYRTSAKLFRWLNFDFSGMFQYKKLDNSGSSNGILSLSPYDMLVDENGARLPVTYGYYTPILERHVPTENFPYSDWTYNPITEIENREVLSKQLNARFQAGLTIKFWEGLSLDSKIQYEMFNTNNSSIYNEKTFTTRRTVNQAASWDKVTNKVTPNIPLGGIKHMSKSELNAYSFRNQLNFNRNFADKHEVNFILGTEINQRITQSTNYPMTVGYDDDKLTVGIYPNGVTGTEDWMGSRQNFSYTNEFSYETDRYFSLFGNVSYTYDGKYTLSGSVRTDASNLITDDPKYRYAPFWSVGIGWQIGKENFMKDMEALDRLNIRVTYGYNGNVDKTTSFRPLIDISATQNTYTHEITSSISSFGNPTLRWEKTGTWDVGIDYSFWGNKLSGKLDLYNKKGKDLITSMTIPAINGTRSQKLNTAQMINRGFELEVSTRIPILASNIVWTGSLNFSYNKNKITNLYRVTYGSYDLYSGGSSAYVEGYNANTLWAYKYAGVVNRGSEDDPYWLPAIHGAEGELFDFSDWTSGDARDYMVNMGTKVAPYTLGFSNSFKIYDFDLSFIITGKFGHKFRRCSFNYPDMSGGYAMPNKYYKEVLESDPMDMVPIPFDRREESYLYWNSYYPYLDYLVENASHVRIQEINLTYNMPTRLLSKIGISSLQIYVQGNNLHTFVANKYDEDPEYPTSMNGGTIRPRASYTLGLKFNF